jgi:hypothetical protein
MLGLKFADIERNEMYDHVAVVHLLDFPGDRLDMEKTSFIYPEELCGRQDNGP